MYKVVILTVLVGLFFGCQAEKPKAVQSTYATLDTLILARAGVLRQHPHLEATPIQGLKAGKYLLFGDSVASRPEVYLQGGRAEERLWLYVYTLSGRGGWVPDDILEAVTADRQRELLALTLLGREQLALADQPLSNIAAEDLRRDSIARRLDRLMAQYPPHLPPPDYFWLQEVLPFGTVLQWSADQHRYILLRDFGAYFQRARQAQDPDTVVYALGSWLYPPDSVEQVCPKYQLPVPGAATYNLCGRGLYVELFERLQSLTGTSSSHPLLALWRSQAVNELTNTGVYYWLPRDSVLREMQQLIEQPPMPWSNSELVALQNRLQELQAAPGGAPVFDAGSKRVPLSY